MAGFVTQGCAERTRVNLAIRVRYRTLPVRVLSRRFRRLFLARLQHAFDAGMLRFFSTLAHLAKRDCFLGHLVGPRHTEWVVYAKEPFGGPGTSWTIWAATRIA